MRILKCTPYPSRPRINTINYLCQLIYNGFTTEALTVINQTSLSALNNPDQHSHLFPLQIAIKTNNIAIIKALLHRGVDIHKQNYNQMSSYDFAIDLGSEEVRELFSFDA